MPTHAPAIDSSPPAACESVGPILRAMPMVLGPKGGGGTGRFSYLWELNMSKSFHEFLHPPKVLNEDGEEGRAGQVPVARRL